MNGDDAMRRLDDQDFIELGVGALLGVALSRPKQHRINRNPFRRPTVAVPGTRVTVSQLDDGNWDIDPYRLKLPTAGKPVTVTWILDPATVKEGFAFEPVKGVFVQDGGNSFSNPRLNANGSFSVDALNSEPDVEFKYGIALLKHGKLYFTIDPTVWNGSRP